MPTRNLLSLSIAALLGFFLGLLEALKELTATRTLSLAEAGLGIAVIVGLSSTLGARASIREHVTVSLLRAGLSGAIFCFVFEGMLLLLKIGQVAPAIAWLIGAGALGLILAQLPPERAPSPAPHPTPQGAMREHRFHPPRRAPAHHSTRAASESPTN